MSNQHTSSDTEQDEKTTPHAILFDLRDRTDMTLGRIRSMLLLLHEDGATGDTFSTGHDHALNIIYFAIEMVGEIKRDVGSAVSAALGIPNG